MVSETMLDLVNTFRKLEEPEDSIPVLGDDQAMRVLAAWTKTDQVWALPAQAMPVMRAGNHAKLWQWLLDGWDLESCIPTLEAATGLPHSVVAEKLDMLVMNRLIYPTGDMSKSARTALAVHVNTKIRAAKRGDKNSAKRDERDGDKDN